MILNDEQIKIQAIADTFSCPKCGGKLITHVAYCRDPECCGGTDYAECDNSKCGWEIECFFGYNEDDYLETLKRILTS